MDFWQLFSYTCALLIFIAMFVFFIAGVIFVVRNYDLRRKEWEDILMKYLVIDGELVAREFRSLLEAGKLLASLGGKTESRFIAMELDYFGADILEPCNCGASIQIAGPDHSESCASYIPF